MSPEQKKLLSILPGQRVYKGRRRELDLALAITKSIVEKHGGKIWMETKGRTKE